MSEVWFDTRLGELLVGEDEFSRQAGSEWDRDDVAALGSAALRIPDMRDFASEIGAETGYTTQGKFDRWTTSDFVHYATRLAVDLMRKPIQEDYVARSREDPKTPTLTTLRTKFTLGISELNEHIGYPNVRSWLLDDYIGFGVNYIEVNGEEMLGLAGITVLAGQQRGPGYTSIMRTFPTFQEYKEEVSVAHAERAQQRRTERERKLHSYADDIARRRLPATFAELSEDDLLTYAGRYWTSIQVAPQLSMRTRLEAVMATSTDYFLNYLFYAAQDLSAAKIEVEAIILGVYDDVWPMNQYREYLKVCPEEVAMVQRRKNRARQAWRDQRRQTGT